ncbi:MAG: serine/threonine-protein kinase [bacterium]
MKNKTIDNRYKILKEIGSGGFAVVYKSWATNLEKFVAVKKIIESYSQDAKFLDMFRNEAINTAKLDHPNIVRVIDFLRTSQNIYYIIMEYVNGKDLRYLIQKCRVKNIRIPLGLTLYIISETLKALEFAYNLTDELDHKQLLLVHRDISPGNIMLYYDGRVKLTDFGIAKVSSKFGEKNKEGVLRGKVSYMSPEQAEGSVEIDNRSDIYSVGIIFFEMLTGKRLFDGKSDYEIWNMAKKSNIDFTLIETASFIPDKIKTILKKSLQKNREERYKSAGAMIHDIQKFMGESYHVQTEGLKDFIGRCLMDEIFEEEKEKLDRNELMQASEEKIPPKLPEPPEPSTANKNEHASSPPLPKPLPEQHPPAPLQGEKTVFDFVLDTAKRHEKIIIYVLLGLISIAGIFFGLDIYKQFTPIGRNIHGRLWPPAMTLDSFPHGAAASLTQGDKEFIGENEQTPIHIDKIIPGNYALKLHKDGFKDIERIITLKGDERINISGTVYTDDAERKYFLFPFEVSLKIESNPPGADVYFDGKKLPGTTPMKHEVEIGKHTIKIFHNGFEPLGSNEMTASYGQCWIDLEEAEIKQKNIDHRYWSFNKQTLAGINTYAIAGSFWKSMDITTDPPACSVYIDDDKDPFGTTPLEQVRLKVGHHRIRISKSGFKPVENDIEISSEIDNKLIYSLMKYIWFRSVSSTNPDKDIKSSVTVGGTSIKNKKTPFRIPLPMKKYKTVFSNEPLYESQTKWINTRDASTVKASLQLRDPYIIFVIEDEITRQPIPNAYILFNDTYQGSTNEKGIWESRVKSGTFDIKINTGERYPEKLISKTLKPGTRQTEKISLNVASECTLDIDTRPHFIGAQIYVDGEYISETIRKIKKLTQGKHKILIRHYDLEEDVQTEIIFSHPKQTIKVRLNERADFKIEKD